ncbi:hypothetical protein WN944_016237 [Citrus x changshan-huyou]|uniref:Uncharacterized protein n=1 Tax=Citrus x changshan-huyou TaxID=2935761 RepID=A0AAP0QMK4_9ROSI
MQKPLYKSDVCKGECRFSISLKQVQQEFLTEQEKILNTCDSQNNKPSKIKAVTLIDPSLNENKISLGKRKMEKTHGPSSESYVLVTILGEIVEVNQLMNGDLVQLFGSSSTDHEASNNREALPWTRHPPSIVHVSCGNSDGNNRRQTHNAVSGLSEVGRQRTEADNTVGPVGSEGGDRCLRSSQRHCLRRSLRLARGCPTWRS